MAMVRCLSKSSLTPAARPMVVASMWRRKEGFTFLELVVVITIMGIMMAVTLPRFSSTFSKATLGGTARGLAGTMAYVRSTAVKDGRSYFLNIDLDNHEYWITYFNEEADLSLIDYEELDILDEEIYTELRDTFVARTKLQKKIEFAQVVLGDGEGISDGVVQIEFRPDGTADETVIHLMNPKERFYTVYLEHYNAQARAYKGVVALEPLPELTEREPARRPSDAL